MEKENPFSPTFPVSPEYFINRDEVIGSFKNAFKRSTKVSTPTPDNIAILGDWGIGKSSVLRKFEAIALKEFKERKTFSAIVELIPATCTSFVPFTSKIIEDINGNFVTQAPLLTKIKNEIKNWRITSLGKGIKLERKINERSPLTAFRDSLLSLWNLLERNRVDTVLLMLDDLHYLAEHYPEGLYDLRGIFQGLPKQGCNFMLCISGKKELFSAVRELAEPLSRFFNIKHTLAPFSLNETKKAILKPAELTNLNLALEENILEKIHNLTAGHPFFIHFIMRELISLKNSGRISLNFFNQHYPDIEKTMEREKFSLDFSIASDKEKRILLAMAGLPGRFSPSEIKIKDARTHLRFLLKKNLITKHERGQYSLYHPLFKDFLTNLKS